MQEKSFYKKNLTYQIIIDFISIVLTITTPGSFLIKS